MRHFLTYESKKVTAGNHQGYSMPVVLNVGV